MKYTLLLLCIALLASCGPTRHKAKFIDKDNTVAIITIPGDINDFYKKGDTVWVSTINYVLQNLATTKTHVIITGVPLTRAVIIE